MNQKLENNRKYISADLFETFELSELRNLSAKELFDLGEIQCPFYKSSNDKTYSAITYSEALEIITKKINSIDPRKSFFYASGRSSNEASFLLDLFARTMGCNHVNTCSNYCHEASGIALNTALGPNKKSIPYDDLLSSDLIFVIGANPTSNHPRFAEILRQHKKNGNKIIAINPTIEPELQKLTSHYCQPNIGGDVALLTGLSKCLIDRDQVNLEQIKNITGYSAFENFIDNVSWKLIEKISGVSRQEASLICDLYLSSERTVFSWGMGLTHHTNGTDNIEAIINLAMLRNMIEGEGKGLLPLRWHDNAPQMPFMGFDPLTKKRIFNSFQQTFGIKFSEYKGEDTLSCMQAAHRGDIEFTFLLGGNLFSVNPDREFSKLALNRIPFKVMINSTLNETNLFGIDNENLILPFRPEDESESLLGIKTEAKIIADIADRSIEREGLSFDHFNKNNDIMMAVQELLPELLMKNDDDPKDLISSDETTKATQCKFMIPTQTSWKIESQSNLFNLSSVRSEGQFNTMIYSEADIFRNQKSRDVLYINAEDIKKLGLSDGSFVDVESETGSLKKVRLAKFDIKPGNVMTYMPEANILIPQKNDKRSKTPSFKSVSVTIINH
jgi:anaerobic selenocysteine-containing dehydrogenase